MPSSHHTVEERARLLSVYLRPWILLRCFVSTHVPHLTDLNTVRHWDKVTRDSVRKRRKTTLASPQRCSYREATYVIFTEPNQNQQLNYLVLIPLTHLVLLLVLVLRVAGGVREQLSFQHPNDSNDVRHSNGATQTTEVSCCSNIKTTQTIMLKLVTGK